ncbi:hypothetical protein HDV57DRAFT_122701 [Trichoderma longibrachiatum]|uniref:Uncharacterized protein n=1 Tax=Trichoderma longibrachiatum ATCC 18648 TaxID=983965 RepID=A0A2T4BRL6_TRILO|nr:hypothetical protein M440DRAFT_1102163 [Trichoderma longibrachiatum ATCC 18648]
MLDHDDVLSRQSVGQRQTLAPALIQTKQTKAKGGAGARRLADCLASCQSFGWPPTCSSLRLSRSYSRGHSATCPLHPASRASGSTRPSGQARNEAKDGIRGRPLPPLAFVTPHPEVPLAARIVILPYVDIQACSVWESRHKHTRRGRARRVTM